MSLVQGRYPIRVNAAVTDKNISGYACNSSSARRPRVQERSGVPAVLALQKSTACSYET